MKILFQIFSGNFDQDSQVSNTFPEEVLARYVRLHVHSSHDVPNLRFDLEGCYDDTVGKHMTGILKGWAQLSNDQRKRSLLMKLFQRMYFASTYP